MVYRGSGGPPPSQVKTELARKPFGFHFSEILPNGKTKRVGLFRVDAGETDIPFVFLDEALPEDGAAPSVRIHDGIRFNGTFGNIVVCVAYRPGGCAMDHALERDHKCFPNCKQPCTRIGNKESVKGGWRWAATGIKEKPFTFTRGKLAGKTVQFQRCLLLVPDAQYDEFVAYREQFGGLRGKVFAVRRKEDKRSSKIGTTWTPVGNMTDEEMEEKYAEAAADYGLPVEDYLRPVDYEQVLRELSTEEMADAARWVGQELGASAAQTSPAPAAVAVTSTAVAGEEEGDDAEIPF